MRSPRGDFIGSLPGPFAFLPGVMLSIMLMAVDVHADELLLTGEIELVDSQLFNVPWQNTMQRTLQWIEEEGAVVEPGDIVVVFDAGDLSNTIEQNEGALEDNAQSSHQALLGIQERIINAEHGVTQAAFRLEIAELKAGIPAANLSSLEHDTAAFDVLKAANDLEQARVTLNSAQEELVGEQERIALEGQRLRAALRRDRELLESSVLRADRRGPVLHAEHPWNGTRFSVGERAQVGFTVASIPSNEEMVVRTWVSEVDWPRVQVGQEVVLIADAYLDQPFSGTVARIGYQSEKRENWSKSSYYPVTVEFERPAVNLIPGMSLLVQVPLNSTALTGGDETSRVNAVGSAGVSVARQTSSSAAITATGHLQSADLVTIRTPSIYRTYNYKIVSLAPEGSYVEEGDPVIRFDPSTVRETLARVANLLAQERQKIRNTTLENESSLAQLNLQLAEKEAALEQSRFLMESAGVVSGEIMVQQRRLEYLIAEDEVKRVRRAIEIQAQSEEASIGNLVRNAERLQYQVDQLSAGLRSLTMSAPRSGLVVYRSSPGGNKPAVGDSSSVGQPIIDIPSLDEMVVVAQVAESDIGGLEPGQSAKLVLESMPNRIFRGEVQSLGKVMRKKNLSQPNMILDVEIRVLDPDPEVMRPGMATRVTLEPVLDAGPGLSN